MERKGDILYDLLDSETGQWETYEKATTLPDGTAINDTNILPFVPLYRKSGTEYFKKTSLSTRAISAKEFGVVADGDFNANTGTDNKPMLQAAVNASVGKELYIPAGDYMLDATNPPLSIPSNIKITLDPNARIKAFPNDEDGYKILNIQGKENIEISGGVIIGDKHSHTGATGQWGHCINIDACKNILIRDITLKEAWGDGIYVGSTSAVSTNIKLQNVTCDDNRRQGLSIVWAKDMYILDSRFTNTDGQQPQAGIDIEPNNDTINENIHIVNCVTTGNSGCGVDIVCPVDDNTKINKDIYINELTSGDNGIAGIRVQTTLSTDDHIDNVNVNGALCYNNTEQDIAIRYGQNINISNVVCKNATADESIRIYRSRYVNFSNFEIYSDTAGIVLEALQYFNTFHDGKIISNGRCIGETDVSVKDRLSFRSITCMSETEEIVRLTNLYRSIIDDLDIERAGKDGIYLNASRSNIITNNSLKDCGSLGDSTYSFLNIFGNSRKNVISNNLIQSVSAPSVPLNGITLSSGSRNNTVTVNSFNITDGSALATKINNLAGGLNFVQITDEYNYGGSTNRPAGANIVTGFMYFDTTIGRPVWWDGDEYFDFVGPVESAELTTNLIDFDNDGYDFFKNITADTTLLYEHEFDGLKASVSVRNTDTNPHTVIISGAPFPIGSTNEIPAGGKAHISLHQIDGEMDASIVIYDAPTT